VLGRQTLQVQYGRNNKKARRASPSIVTFFVVDGNHSRLYLRGRAVPLRLLIFFLSTRDPESPFPSLSARLPPHIRYSVPGLPGLSAVCSGCDGGAARAAFRDRLAGFRNSPAHLPTCSSVL